MRLPQGDSNPEWPNHHTKKYTKFYLAKLTSKVDPPEASHLRPPSNDAGGAAPPSSGPHPPSSTPATDGPGTSVSPDGATLDATINSDNEGDEGDHATPLRGRPKLQTARINRDALLLFCNDANACPPDVRCCDTPNGSDSLQDLTSDKIYHLFGNRRFRNYEHFGRVSKDAKFVQGGEPCPSLGKFANL